jgi:hypothetical protein
MLEYHGIVVDVSQRDQSIFSRLKILGKKKTGDWTLFKVGVEPGRIERTIKQLQENMVEETFYFHFYKDNELIVVFNNRTFRTTTDESKWREVIEYGKSLGIPEKQLDFYPCRIEEETY